MGFVDPHQEPDVVERKQPPGGCTREEEDRHGWKNPIFDVKNNILCGEVGIFVILNRISDFNCVNQEFSRS